MEKMIAALEAELNILKANRGHEVDRAKGLLDINVNSRHLAHNLGNVVTEIAAIDGKIEQTERILRSLQAATEGK